MARPELDLFGNRDTRLVIAESCEDKSDAHREQRNKRWGRFLTTESPAKPAQLGSSHLLSVAVLFSQQLKLKILSLLDNCIKSRIVLLGLHDSAFRVSTIRRHTRMLNDS